jgi:ubiquinone/menaquinone biosynthesis C-methylase UbiE
MRIPASSKTMEACMSVVFDRAVSFYDRTRGLPRRAEDWLAQAIDQQTSLQPGSSVLEIGVGTGRIALPLIRAQHYRYIGIDLSRTMMEALRSKAQDMPITLIQGDVAHLPFTAGTFDAVVAVHVFHLVSDWQLAMDEVKRVLRPGGILLHGRNHTADQSPLETLRKHLHESAQATEPDPQPQTGFLEQKQIRPALERHFGSPRQVATPYWHVTRTPGEVIDSFADRCWSSTWALSDAALKHAVAEGRRWASERFGSLDRPLHDEQRFVWDVYSKSITR